MSQTGGLSTFFPLIALTNSGSSAVPTEASSATASEAPPSKRSNQFPTPRGPRSTSGREGALPPTALQRTAESCRRLGPARADLPPRRGEVDGSESGGHAVAIWDAGIRAPPRSRMRGRGGGDAAVGGELATTWLGLAGRLGWLAQPLRRWGESEGDWGHRIRLDERIRDEMNGVDNSVGHRDAPLVGRGLWRVPKWPNPIRIQAQARLLTPEWRASFFLKKS